MIKKKMIKLSIILSMFLISFVSVNAVGGEPPLSPGKYQNGVGNLTIYIDSASGADYWQIYITGGADNWMYPGSGMSNPIYMNFVSSNYGSNIDFYAKPKTFWDISIRDGVMAETRHFDDSDNRIYGGDRDWYSAMILINDDNFREDWFSNEQAQGTVIHEMGHALGLNENNSNPNSIMCQLGSGRTVQRVQQVDNNAINRKY